MPTGTALYPLSDIVALDDFPLAAYLPADQASAIFDELYYTSATSSFDGVNLTLDLELAFEQELALSLPGSDAISIVAGSGGGGWTVLPLRLIVGPDFEFSLVQVPISLRVSADILEDAVSGGPAEIGITGDLRIDADGISLNRVSGASLADAYLCGTSITVAAADIRPVFGYGNLPDWMADDPAFSGLAIQSLEVTIPADLLQLDAGSNLAISITNAAIGNTGFSGVVSVSADPAQPVRGTLLGFPFRFREFSLDIQQNALLELRVGADLRLEVFEDGGTEKWVGVDLLFGDNGSLAGSLSAVQPAEASASAALVEVIYPGVFQIAVASLRITKDGSLWAVYVSGSVRLLLSGSVAWPEIEIDEIGVDSAGKLLLPDGAGIAFASPLVVEWHFVRLSITKFRFGYAEENSERLQLGLSAEVLLLEGLPAGVSVEGLIVEWTPGSGAAPSVRLEGIGVSLGVPGAFQASIYVAYQESAGTVEFRGKGSLELTALDMGIDIGIVVGYQSAPPPAFAFLYLFADAKLLPTGIPIAQTGISIYGFQGLLAYNMGLAIDLGLPEDERFYELFVRPPIGITDVNKWEKRLGQNALGVGVVLGTADCGFCLNVKGLLVIAFPDLTILLQATANFLKLKPDLSTAEEGTMDALLVYASGQNTLSLDIVAHWGIPVLVNVEASARAFFSFTNPLAWYLEIGRDEDGKRAGAHVLEWDGRYLFSAGFWFHLDAHGLITGAQVDLELRAEAGGFWVEAAGHARGVMALSWLPPQWEGMLAMSGHLGAGYRGASISISLGGSARARVKNPFDVHIRVQICIEIIFEFCHSFNFDWKSPDPPALEAPVGKWSATPRHWTPRELPAATAVGALDTGVVSLAPGTASVPSIQPHSFISLEFAKAMVDVTTLFNEAVSFDDEFVTIGRDSGWAAAFRLDSVSMLRDPDGAAESVALWGTWARETLLPNTTLRLNSSIRFGDDGSLTYGYLEPVRLDYCDEPKPTVRCVDLTGLEPGYGYLDDGSLYHWDHPGDEPADSDGGVVLTDDDVFEVFLPGGAEDIVVVSDPNPPKPNGDDGSVPGRLCRHKCVLVKLAFWLSLLILLLLLLLCSMRRFIPPLLLLAILCDIVLVVLLAILWRCLCPWRRDPTPVRDPPAGDKAGPPGGKMNDQVGGSDPLGEKAETPASTVHAHAPGPIGGRQQVPVTPDPSGRVVLKGSSFAERVIQTICYAPGHGTPDWATLATRGGLITENESWTVPDSMSIYPPNELFELRVEYTARLRAPDDSISMPLGSAVPIIARFRTSGPPAYENALRAYIASVYPFEGARPVYTGYDIKVQFLEEYVPYLYTSVGEELSIRLIDGQGQPIRDASGNDLLLPAAAQGLITRTTSQEVWENIYQVNVERNCIEGPPIGVEGPTIVALPLGPGFALTPNSQYIAQLVSDARPDIPLHAWSFTTSRFTTFLNLVRAGRTILASRAAAQPLSGNSFDGLARQAGVPTVAYLGAFQITPLLTPDGAAVAALLFESPEPLELNLRLTVSVNGIAASAVPNLDSTRGFILPPSGTWPLGTLDLSLIWKRSAGASLPVLSINGDMADETDLFSIEAGAQP